MALPALASVSALATWLHATIDDEDARAQAVLATASTLVRSRAGKNWVDAEGALESDIPDGIGQVVVLVAARLWLNPTSATQTTTGPFAASWSSGFELTDAEAAMVDDAIGATKIRGLGVISTTRSPVGVETYVDVEGGQPIVADVPDAPSRGVLW